jgi:hypothetical protein
MTPGDFKGVTLDDLVILQQVFSLNAYVYDLQKTEAGSVYHTANTVFDRLEDVPEDRFFTWYRV